MSYPRLSSGNLTKAEFISTLDEEGFVVVEGMVTGEFCEKMIPELEQAIAKEAAFHGSTSFKDYGMLIACPMYGGKFLELADNRQLMEPFDWILGDTCIIYVYTSSSMPPRQTNYSARIHVDRPHLIPGYTEALGCLILLDDFTAENGATWVLPKSHKTEQAPDEDFFYKHAVRINAPKGSVLYFNLRTWHAGGINNTGAWRHCVGMGMIRGHLKQRIDLPRALAGVDLKGISNFGFQKLGFFSQPPASLAEYYAPEEMRTYRQRSEWEPAN